MRLQTKYPKTRDGIFLPLPDLGAVRVDVTGRAGDRDVGGGMSLDPANGVRAGTCDLDQPSLHKGRGGLELLLIALDWLREDQLIGFFEDDPILIEGLAENAVDIARIIKSH